MIKYKFLNYQTYQAFKADLDNQDIPNDSIVFIKDVRKIWARGAEYSCDTQIQVNDNTLTLLNSDGTQQAQIEFVNYDTFNTAIETINTQLGRLAADLNEEVVDRETECYNLRHNIEDETSARNAGDTAITSFITSNIIPTITTEINDRKTESISNAIYEDTKIKFKNKFDDVVAVIDANSFIKDGMVDSVSIVDNAGNKALKIIFNTDSGKDPITIDIGDIFELDDYYTKSQLYTKTEIDNKQSSVQNNIDTEIARATNAESIISNNISSEINRAISAEQALQTNKQDKLVAGEGIDITNNNISVIDYISEGDINAKLRTLQQMLGEIYVLKEDVYDPERNDWSQAPIYPFGDIAVSGGGTVNRNDIYALDQHSFDVLVQNNQVRNDVCYLITD